MCCPAASATGAVSGATPAVITTGAVTEATVAAAAEKGADEPLCGRVTDAHGEGIFGACLQWQKARSLAAVSDLDGRFRLPRSTAGDTLLVSCLGYRSLRLPASELPTGDSLLLRLSEDMFSLSAVTVSSQPDVAEEFSIDRIGRMDIYLLPTSAGDPLNAITIQPYSTGDGESANLELRGSSAEASQVILNGIRVNNPVRNTQLNGLGNFSLFNPELLKEMRVHAGNPPLTHGNSVAGCAELETVDRLEQNLSQVAVSAANLGWLHQRRTGENAFFQVYGNRQFDDLYLKMNDVGDCLDGFGSTDLGLNLHWQSETYGANLYAYTISERYAGSTLLQGQTVSCKARRERYFGVMNLFWHRGPWRLQLDVGRDNDLSDNRLAETDHRLQLSQWQGRLYLKYYAGDKLFLQGGLDHDRLREKAAGQASLTLTELYGYARWRLGDWVLGGALRKPLQGGPSRPAWQTNVKYSAGAHSVQAGLGSYYGYLSPSLLLDRVEWQTSRQAVLEYAFRTETFCLKGAAFRKQESGPVYLEYQDCWIDCRRQYLGLEGLAEAYTKHFRTSVSCTRLDATMKTYCVSPCRNDMPYIIKGMASHTDASLMTVALSFILRPGYRYTPIVGGEWNDTDACWMPIYGPINSERLGDYRRFDLSLNRVVPFGQGRQAVFFATFTNVFNRCNEAGFAYDSRYGSRLSSVPGQGYTVYAGMQWSL